MAGATGLTGKPMMRDAVLENDQAYLSPMDKEIAGLTKPGNLDPRYPAHREMILTIADAIKGGQVSEENAAKVAELNPGAKPFFLKALAERQQSASVQKEFSPFFQPGQPARESIPGQGYGPPELSGPNAGIFPASGARDAVAPVNDLSGAALHARNKGMYTLADQFDKSAKESQGKGMYGGIRTGVIPGTTKLIEYGVDELTGQVKEVGTGRVLTRGKDYEPTVGVTNMPVLGGGISAFPNRMPSGGSLSPSPTGAVSMPTAEETKQVGQSQTAFDMGNEMRQIVTEGRAKVGPIDGRRMKAAAMTGINLTPDDAKMISYEENLSNQLLQAMRGAQVGPAEQVEFEKSLPRLDQPTPLFLQNIETTMNNLRTLRETSAKLRSTPNPKQEKIETKTTKPFSKEEIRKELERRRREGKL